MLTTNSPLKVTRVPHVENVTPSRGCQRSKQANTGTVLWTTQHSGNARCSAAAAFPSALSPRPASLLLLRCPPLPWAPPGQPCLTPNSEGFNLPFAREMAKSLSNADFFSRLLAPSQLTSISHVIFPQHSSSAIWAISSLGYGHLPPDVSTSYHSPPQALSWPSKSSPFLKHIFDCVIPDSQSASIAWGKGV